MTGRGMIRLAASGLALGAAALLLRRRWREFHHELRRQL